MDLNKYIDYTNIKNDATSKDIAYLCSKAMEYGFETVCVQPCYVTLAKELLEGSNVNVCTVVSLGSGMSSPKTKAYEAIDAVEMGADEIGLFINIGALKDKDYDFVKKEIEEVRDSIDGKILKVIVETHELEKEEIVKITEICNETFVNYIEIYNSKKHTEDSFEDIKIVNEYRNDILEIKVSGHIKYEEEILKLIDSGATRIGMSKISKLIKKEKCKEGCKCEEHECKCENHVCECKED